jgi:excisionase family DNA binding protein
VKNDRFLSAKEAAEYLAISRNMLWKLRRDSGLTFYKFEKKIVFKKSDLDAFMLSFKIEKKPPRPRSEGEPAEKHLKPILTLPERKKRR